MPSFFDRVSHFTFHVIPFICSLQEETGFLILSGIRGREQARRNVSEAIARGSDDSTATDEGAVFSVGRVGGIGRKWQAVSVVARRWARH